MRILFGGNFSFFPFLPPKSGSSARKNTSSGCICLDGAGNYRVQRLSLSPSLSLSLRFSVQIFWSGRAREKQEEGNPVLRICAGKDNCCRSGTLQRRGNRISSVLSICYGNCRGEAAGKGSDLDSMDRDYTRVPLLCTAAHCLHSQGKQWNQLLLSFFCCRSLEIRSN